MLGTLVVRSGTKWEGCSGWVLGRAFCASWWGYSDSNNGVGVQRKCIGPSGAERTRLQDDKLKHLALHKKASFLAYTKN
jgi:hypothetical protein